MRTVEQGSVDLRHQTRATAASWLATPEAGCSVESEEKRREAKEEGKHAHASWGGEAKCPYGPRGGGGLAYARPRLRLPTQDLLRPYSEPITPWMRGDHQAGARRASRWWGERDGAEVAGDQRHELRTVRPRKPRKVPQVISAPSTLLPIRRIGGSRLFHASIDDRCDQVQRRASGPGR